MSNAYLRLREQCLANSTRPFLARGASVKRCPDCQLGCAMCICAWRLPTVCAVDFVLLMHRDEVFKPTNTGRLIADVLPDNTYAFEWSRIKPAPALVELLADPLRYCVVVFPADATTSRLVHSEASSLPAEKKLTLIMLDGTWKQARKMFKSSAWLQSLPLLALQELLQGRYAVRKALKSGQLSTAEAAAAVLRVWGEPAVGQLLEDYFAIFNQHYLATRANSLPPRGACHQRIEAELARRLSPVKS